MYSNEKHNQKAIRNLMNIKNNKCILDKSLILEDSTERNFCDLDNDYKTNNPVKLVCRMLPGERLGEQTWSKKQSKRKCSQKGCGNAGTGASPKCFKSSRILFCFLILIVLLMKKEIKGLNLRLTQVRRGIFDIRSKSF